ncbi:unnamed protein product [Acanthoscelides obtectus]|uniref:Uncharacterized protein n=1 Tax=Acanthoscelides obtectus TaxID=200917 RepID=A0A9P0L4E8_ACAOB|nr:unnamed protein product [Acanthoscelides obtectus]CAK1619844.1 hypothetical protein AOBTE_LOCUS21 [Acanthoscelides obtectus]
MCKSTVKNMVESRIVIRNCVINLTNILLEELEEVLEEEENTENKDMVSRMAYTEKKSRSFYEFNKGAEILKNTE